MIYLASKENVAIHVHKLNAVIEHFVEQPIIAPFVFVPTVSPVNRVLNVFELNVKTIAIVILIRNVFRIHAKILAWKEALAASMRNVELEIVKLCAHAFQASLVMLKPNVLSLE